MQLKVFFRVQVPEASSEETGQLQDVDILDIQYILLQIKFLQLTFYIMTYFAEFPSFSPLDKFLFYTESSYIRLLQSCFPFTLPLIIQTICQ